MTAELGEQRCGQNDSQTLVIANIIYAGLSFTSFLISLSTFLFITFRFCRKRISTEHSELLFILSLAVLTWFSCIESFQWIFLFSDSVAGRIACQVLAAFREYGAAMLFILTGCVGCHLIIIMKPPKCLMVIGEMKMKRYRNLILFYSSITVIVPLLFVPLPFVIINNHYGPSDYACWISQYDESCNDSDVGLIEQAALLYFWALIATITLVVVVIIVLATLLSRTQRKCTATSSALIVLTVVLLITTMAIGSLFVSDLIIGQRRVSTVPWILYTQVTCIPLSVALVSITLFCRTYYLGRVHKQNQNVCVPVPVKKEETKVFHPHEATPLLTACSSSSYSVL